MSPIVRQLFPSGFGLKWWARAFTNRFAMSTGTKEYVFTIISLNFPSKSFTFEQFGSACLALLLHTPIHLEYASGQWRPYRGPPQGPVAWAVGGSVSRGGPFEKLICVLTDAKRRYSLYYLIWSCWVESLFHWCCIELHFFSKKTIKYR